MISDQKKGALKGAFCLSDRSVHVAPDSLLP